MNSRKALLSLFAGLLLSVPHANAGTLTFNFVSGADAFYGGTAFDPSTGNYYRNNGYNPTQFSSFGTQAGFESNSGGTSISLSGGQPVGTYFAVNGGYVYGHVAVGSNSNSATVGQWSLASGQLVATASPSGFGALNGQDSYNWGGFSAMNVFNTSAGMYLFSGVPNTLGQQVAIGSLGQNLSVTNVHDVDLSAFGGSGSAMGWGFMIGDKYFGSALFTSNVLNYEIDASTGIAIADTISTSGLSGGYITQATYVPNTDSLYVWDAGSLYKSSDVAEALGLPRRRSPPLSLSSPPASAG